MVSVIDSQYLIAVDVFIVYSFNVNIFQSFCSELQLISIVIAGSSGRAVWGIGFDRLDAVMVGSDPS
jgi:hypothetical protein